MPYERISKILQRISITNLKIRRKLFDNDFPSDKTFNEHVCGLEVDKLNVFLDERLIPRQC